jgi:hypothetical protein
MYNAMIRTKDEISLDNVSGANSKVLLNPRLRARLTNALHTRHLKIMEDS